MRGFVLPTGEISVLEGVAGGEGGTEAKEEKRNREEDKINKRSSSTGHTSQSLSTGKTVLLYGSCLGFGSAKSGQ